MSDDAAPLVSGTPSLEGRDAHELVRDEDVLSLDMQHALESVGTGVGVVAAIALVVSQLPRAAGFLRAIRSSTSASAVTHD